ncbi:MFS transporter [Lentzea terrae]|uniref:MFS transporter n=1 Tax=Lentzea terrae TaxID=2200761 RepID=UPI000DD41069|nr:MFS transporter [Lentzea terrae]
MWRYLTSAGLARLADEMVVITLALLAWSRTGDELLTGVTTAAYALPAVVTGPLLGAWLDRTRHPLVALAGNQFLLAAMAVGLIVVPAPLLPVLAFVAGLTLPMTSGGFTSMLPRLGVDLPRVTAYDSMLYSGTAIAGLALASIVAVVWSPAGAMAVVSALAFAGGLVTLRLVLAPAPPSPHSSLLPALRAGARTLVRTPPLRAATLTSVISFVGFGMLVVTLPVLLPLLHAHSDLSGLVLAAFDLGAVLAVLAVRPYLSRWLPERVLFVTVALYGVSFALWTLAGNLVVLTLLALLAGFASGPTLAALITARQRYSPPELLGQVSTTGASLKIGAFALGSLLAGVLLSSRTPATALLVIAALQFVAVGAGLIAARRPVRLQISSGTPGGPC